MSPWPLLRSSNASWRKLNLTSQLHGHWWQSQKLRWKIMVGLDQRPHIGSAMLMTNTPQGRAVPVDNSKQEQDVRACAAQLRDEVSYAVPSIVNVNWGAGSQTRNTWLIEDTEVSWCKTTQNVRHTSRWRRCLCSDLKELVVSKVALVSSTPQTKLPHLTVNISSYETSENETESEMETATGYAEIGSKNREEEVRAKTAHPFRRAKPETSMVAYSF